jgi:hypothetical protein
MKARTDCTPLLMGAALFSALFSGESFALNEALSLAVQNSSPGGLASASISLKNPADVESFNLRLTFIGGGVLSLPASNWFVRGLLFPSTPFGFTPRVELNHSAGGATPTRIYFDGFNPVPGSGGSGAVGRVVFKIASTATQADSQVVTVSGEFWSRAEQKLKTLPSASARIQVVPNDWDDDKTLDLSDTDDDGDGTPDRVDSQPLDRRFRGSEQVAASVNNAWKTVTLPSLFNRPVIIAGPPSYHDAQPGVVRIRNITAQTFETAFREWDYLDRIHASEAVPYLVVESGRRTMPDGTVWEAGTFSLGGTGAWNAWSFGQPFAGTPRLFLTVQSYNGAQAVAVRARNVTAGGFEAALFEQELGRAFPHSAETVGYVAIYSPRGSGTVSIGGRDLPYLLRQELVDERWTPVLSSAIQLQEEQSLDPETAHGDEKMAVMGLGNQLYAQDITSLDAEPAAPRRKPPEYAGKIEWGSVSGVGTGLTTIPLAKAYAKPVVIAKVGQQPAGADPGTVRLRVAASCPATFGCTSFQASFQEWPYLDKIHGTERIFYLVAEEGAFTLAGLKGEARRVVTDKVLAQGSASVAFTQPFPALPALFSGVMSYADAETVITRIKNLALGGFGIAMQEQESSLDGHPAETLGWIAIAKGTGRASDGRRIAVIGTDATHLPVPLTFSQVFSRRFPVLLQDLSSSNGADPAVAAQRNLKPTGVEVYVQEEQSANDETDHGSESISIFGAE